MLLESVLLAIGGGIVGVVLSLWATNALSSFRLPVPIPMDLSVAVDWRVILYTFVLSLVAGILCGIVPAFAASRPVISRAIKGEEVLVRHSRRFTLRNLLVVTQITLSLVLLCAAGLFLRSLQSAASISSGFRSSGVLILAVDPQLHDYPPARTIQLLTTVRQRITALPGVISATTTDFVPLSMMGHRDGFTAEGMPPIKDSIVDMYMVGPDYFSTLGIPRLSGRDLTDESPDAPKLTIVNQELVRRFFQNQNPIGRHIIDGGVSYEVIGVVRDTKSNTIGEDQQPIMYRAINQTIAKDPSQDGYKFILRYQGDPAPLAAAVRRIIHAEDPNLAVFNTQTMQQLMHDALFLPRLVGTLFGSIGLLLASVGLFSVVSYSVSRRTKEIGIRMALGARAVAVQKLIVRGGMWLVLISTAIGLPLALAAAKLATALLYGVQPYDLITFTAVPIILFAVTLLACWLPSRRASRVDPMIALRVD
jgi:predicted permease